MSSYKELLDQANDLMRQANEARSKERVSALDSIRQIMKEFDLSVSDLESKQKTTKPSKKEMTGDYFQGPSGQKWSGRGRPPEWVKQAKENGQELTKVLAAPATA